MSAAIKLVENNLHQLEVRGQHLLFHIPSTGLFATDEPTRDVILAAPPSSSPAFIAAMASDMSTASMFPILHALLV